MAKRPKGRHQFCTAHDLKENVCPMCGKTFIPAPFHQFKTYDQHPLLVCSYPCDKKAFKEYTARAEQERATRKARYRAKHPLHVENITPEKWAICTECGFVKETYSTQAEAEQALENWRD